MKVFRRSGRPGWYAWYHDEDGKRKKVALGTDRVSAEQRLAQIIRDVERRKAGIITEDDDRMARAAAASIETLMGQWRTSLRAGGSTEKHIEMSVRRVTIALKHQQITSISRLDKDEIEAFLVALRNGEVSTTNRNRESGQLDANPVAPRTVDHYLMALRQFIRWCVKSKRLSEDPTESVVRLTQQHRLQDTATVCRVALNSAQVAALIAAAPRRSVDEYRRVHADATDDTIQNYRRAGVARSVCYALGFHVCLRAGSIRGLVWGDLRIDDPEPHALLRAPYQKDRREKRVPLVPAAVSILRGWKVFVSDRDGLNATAESRPVVRVPRWIVEQMRKDAQFAGIRIPADMTLDFHALRHSAATEMVRRGVPPSVAQRMLQHSTIQQTLQTYAKLGVEDLHAALAVMPGAREAEHFSKMMMVES